MKRSLWVLPILLALVGAMWLSHTNADAAAPHTLAHVRKAVAPLQDFARAEALGYRPTGMCIDAAMAGMGGSGAMGIHFVNKKLLRDPQIDALRPENLLYAPSRTGLKLIGVEYERIDSDQNANTIGDRPTLFGQPFDGPMAGHEAGEPVHYALHVWLWRTNPRGTFAPFNPRVRC